jgi:hypothetical protein
MSQPILDSIAAHLYVRPNFIIRDPDNNLILFAGPCKLMSQIAVSTSSSTVMLALAVIIGVVVNLAVLTSF